MSDIEIRQNAFETPATRVISRLERYLMISKRVSSESSGLWPAEGAAIAMGMYTRALIEGEI